MGYFGVKCVFFSNENRFDITLPLNIQEKQNVLRQEILYFDEKQCFLWGKIKWPFARGHL